MTIQIGLSLELAIHYLVPFLPIIVARSKPDPVSWRAGRFQIKARCRLA